MSKPKKKPARHRRPAHHHQQRSDPNFWEDQLEQRLNEFGASTSDLPEIDPESCQTKKQHVHAVRVRARYLARQIRAIQQVSKGDAADRLFAGVMERAAVIEDGSAWFTVEKESQKSTASASSQESAGSQDE